MSKVCVQNDRKQERDPALTGWRKRAWPVSLTSLRGSQGMEQRAEQTRGEPSKPRPAEAQLLLENIAGRW